jgi:YOP proteins translocation protein K (YscK)
VNVMGDFDTELLKELYQRDDSLLAMIMEFNVAPARFVHSSWLESVADYTRVSSLCGQNRFHTLSRYLCSSFQLNDHFCWDFSRPGTRLLLLPGSVLTNMILFTGLAIHHRTISYCIEGAVIEKMKRSFGDSGYSFALENAELLVGSMGAAPEKTEIDDLVSRVRLTGLSTLTNAVGELREGWEKRLRLKFSRSSSFDLPKGEPENTSSSLELCKRILSFQTQSQWAFIFK